MQVQNFLITCMFFSCAKLYLAQEFFKKCVPDGKRKVNLNTTMYRIVVFNLPNFQNF